jgi:hypothetical protein
MDAKFSLIAPKCQAAFPFSLKNHKKIARKSFPFAGDIKTPGLHVSSITVPGRLNPYR